MKDQNRSGKRIAKNTLLLYGRMILMMVISLYTSRVILQSLGVEDFGTYNVVGGFVAMFSMLSGSLSNAISRFIQVELGKNDFERLKNVFSTSVTIQGLMAIVVGGLAEAIGLWFVYYKMNVDPSRLYAVQWVLHCSVITFGINLISIPYNSAIIAHEKMSAFAYISILEAIAKLAMTFAILIMPFDRLITYSVLLVVVSVFIRYMYTLYCSKTFAECKYQIILDKPLLKEMGSFAGWNMLGQGVHIINQHGINLLLNLYFGVVVNAARGVAFQVNNAVQQFITNFMTAMTPQITKSYAAGDKEYAFRLTCLGSKFSFFLFYLFALPIMIEAEELLSLWLSCPPEHTITYMRWIILTSLATVIANTMFTLQMAHGNIKRYQVITAFVAGLAFPISWFGYKMEAPSEWAFMVLFAVSLIQIFTRFFIVSSATGFPFKDYIIDVVLRAFIVAVLAATIPMVISFYMDESLTRFLIIIPVSVISCIIFIYLLGINKNEKLVLFSMIKKIIKR